MSIVLVMNKPSREAQIMEAVKTQILSRQPDAQVYCLDHDARDFLRQMFRFRPDVILTFPFTGQGLSARYYLLKAWFQCRIFCFRAEGVLDIGSAYNIDCHTGFDQYGSQLVDRELFWGRQMADAVGPNLVRQGKLSGMDRVEIVGYPRLESYFKKKTSVNDFSCFPDRVAMAMRIIPRERRLLFATGFHLANYTKDDLFAAGDLDAEHRLNELLEAVEITKRYRQQWITGILTAAARWPDLLFILKKHPTEKREDYAAIESLPNILFIYENMDISEVVPHASLFFHYGSTSLVDAYLSHVPAVYVFSPLNKPWYSDLGWPSSRRVDIVELGPLIEEHHDRRIQFTLTVDMKRVLKDVFDITEGQPYTPVENIVDCLLRYAPPQRIPLSDVYLWKSLLVLLLRSIRFGVVQSAKWVLGIEMGSHFIPGFKARFNRKKTA